MQQNHSSTHIYQSIWLIVDRHRSHPMMQKRVYKAEFIPKRCNLIHWNETLQRRRSKISIFSNVSGSFSSDEQLSWKFCNVPTFRDGPDTIVESKVGGISYIGKLPMFLFNISLALKKFYFSTSTSNWTFLWSSNLIFGSVSSSPVIAPPQFMTPTSTEWVLNSIDSFPIVGPWF